ncbi:MAG: class I SAM-dependent methyltransferase [Planctomycetaceae bacterium]|nr:class I SAM-dependent methyltransferase [Planctomycetaceae bacterium]
MPTELVVHEMVTGAAQRLKGALEAVESELACGGPAEAAYARVRAAVDEFLAQLRATELWGVANRQPSVAMWNIVGPQLARAWLIDRARTKPRGYAGDYELLGRMYENRLCDDRLGRLLDRYFQDDAAPVAVRNRMRMITDWIVEGVRVSQGADAPRSPLRIAIVGSAFGLDVRDALARLDEHERAGIAVTFMDIDPAAVDFARAQLEPLLPTQRITTASGSVLRLHERPRLAEPLADTDLLFCPGIFDYLDDGAAADMLGLFWEQLAPGGRMVVFQFALHNPSRALMEWIGNWYLIYRDDVQLRQVTERAGVPPEAASFGAEPLGADLYVSAVRP